MKEISKKLIFHKWVNNWNNEYILPNDINITINSKKIIFF